jgi:protein-tyrosine-phosphatase
MKILCVDIDDTTRAPMLNAILSRQFITLKRDDIEVQSAGLDETHGNSADESACIAMEQKGILTLRNHRTRPLDSYDLDSFDVIICMNENQVHEVKQKLTNGTRVLVAHTEKRAIPSPFGLNQEAFVDCAHTLAEASEELLPQIVPLEIQH